ncbi:TlyA family RNA methyltransferase [Cellulomonas aerilata]|uniref:TlyA family rRNA (Cytidine-2'-O)-methyltransferase n=1 Tax=Cellulomonas aerilata TaxID=515326 RepID=A0A512DFW7_9CELL|nr:TlyA family RNA methyltransferase [Cellulomonas aerilata]GEO35306.1 TlyA family rRNA (cytidine-2'-O)-methyltransferase [Cellulomonas aerilata]
MPDRGRLDAELVRRGLARSRRHAGELIAAGRVQVSGAVAAKSSVPVAPEQPIDVAADGSGPQYASRAGHKLAGALDALGPDGPRVVGRRCLDAGASTGGFTDVLLTRGAEHVTAVDVGHGQLVPRLLEDPRVTAREGVNVRHLTRADVEPRPELVVGDLSFISLTLVLPALAEVVAPGGDLLLMVKPQFEVGRERLGTGGVVRDAALRTGAVLDVALAALRAGLQVRDVVASPLPGPGGNVEYFLWLQASEAQGDDARVGGTRQDVADHDGPDADLRRLVERAVAEGPTGEGATWSSGTGSSATSGGGR